MRILRAIANLTELLEGVTVGLVDGCTTNPPLIAKEQRSVRSLSLEVVASDFEGMIKEGKELAQVRGE